jgi:hypothetical protein
MSKAVAEPRQSRTLDSRATALHIALEVSQVKSANKFAHSQNKKGPPQREGTLEAICQTTELSETWQKPARE